MEHCPPNQAMVERMCVRVCVRASVRACVHVSVCACLHACMCVYVEQGLLLEKVKAFLGKAIGNPIVCLTLTGASSYCNG